jgi:hypothetical protein
MGDADIAPGSVRAMLNGKPSDEERANILKEQAEKQARTLKEEADRLQHEAQQLRIATELHEATELKRSYVEPSWRKNKKDSR